MIPKYVYILFVIVAFFGLLPYIKQIISKKVRPNLVGWAMWSLAPLIAFAAQIKNGGGIETITTLSVGLVPLIVIVAALLAHSYVKQYTTTDAACFVFAVTGLILWRITKQPDLAIAFSIAADLFAGVPTMLHAYRKPLEENHWPFTSSIPSFVCAILVVKLSVWSFSTIAFSTYLLLINSSIAFIIYSRTKAVARAKY